MTQQLLFGSPESAEILKKQSDEERHSDGVLTLNELQRMSAELYAALKIRNDCQECGGAGGRWVHVLEDDCDFDVCDCVTDAAELLERYGRWFLMVAARYLSIPFPEIVDMDEGYVSLEIEVMSKVKEK